MKKSANAVSEIGGLKWYFNMKQVMKYSVLAPGGYLREGSYRKQSEKLRGSEFEITDISHIVLN